MTSELASYLEQPQSVPKAIASAIRSAIRSGRLSPGDRLFDSQIAEQMGNSRGSVREAFRILEQQGLVRIEARKGVFVSELSTNGVEELYTLRALLEGHAVRLAVEKQGYDPTTLSELQGLVSQIYEGDSQGDPLETLEFDLRFHDLMCSRCGHTLLLGVLASLHGQIERFHVATRFARDTSELADEHRLILETIASGDALGAERAVRDHIVRAGELLIERLT